MNARIAQYGQHLVEEDDIAAVCGVLRGDWLTGGPAVGAFEAALCELVGANHAIACNSGTAALYIAARAAGLAPGDTVLVPAVTFLATASASILAGLDIVFTDVDPETGLMRVDDAAEALRRARGKRVKAVFPVHLAGQLHRPAELKSFADRNGLAVIEDSCHAIGTRYGEPQMAVGACRHSLAACFSFHPVKTIAMGEGGAVTTNEAAVAERARLIRNHGMTRDPATFRNTGMAFDARGKANPWYYEAHEISHNFRLSDINCALGASQLKKIDRFAAARRKLVAHYRERLRPLAPKVVPVPQCEGVHPVWHLFCVLADFERIGLERAEFMLRLRAAGVGSQVHYVPVHLQPYYRERVPTPDLPGANAYYNRTLSLPLTSAMTTDDVDQVVDTIANLIGQ
ncbi:MAG TPA: UDP-4-amino-4,6-dideoxy-N-acetyl-beta-L-altrosamine transaminase [Burkholderiales bacterium]|nr:UDP-4-amino-4,6-dideoxy-N-acetyl-beta-L-altrosamine transaminase [Burkholderiales bacterium]